MIVFTYKLADFLNNAQVISMYRATALVQGKGELHIDDASITFDDTAVLKSYLRLASSFIVSMMSGYAKDLYDTDGTTPLEAFETNETDIIFRINDPVSFKQSNIPVIDESIKDSIINYLIFRINKNKGHNFESFEDDYNRANSSILLYLNQRSKPVARKYNLF